MLEVTELTRSYGSHVAIEKVSFQVADGELVAVTRVPDRLGVVFQDYSRSLYPWLSVLDNVALPLRRTARRRAARRRTAIGALESVGLVGFAGRYPWQLSGGMQQRVAIARVIVLTPGPGRVLADMPVDLPAPRDHQLPPEETQLEDQDELTVDDERRKLELVASTAGRIWG